ncbi:MAG: hypothetical protein KatS3mg002_0245 [Candidatus Woesearchaeota archaeon]|nr:MAG: hypothetical protein KatS3mg002_0245 [Candidatus Woesearchaeota archaeon]
MSLTMDLSRPIFIINNSTRLYYQKDNYLCYLKFIEPFVFNELSFPGAYLIIYIHTNTNHEVINYELEYKWSYDNIKIWDSPLTLNTKKIKDDINFLFENKENNELYKTMNIVQFINIIFNLDICNYLDFVGNDIFPTIEDWKELSQKNKYFYLHFTELTNSQTIADYLFQKDIVLNNSAPYEYLDLERSPKMINLDTYKNITKSEDIIWLNNFWIQPGDKILYNKEIYTVKKIKTPYIYLEEKEQPLRIHECKNIAVIPEKDIDFVESLLQVKDNNIIEALYNNTYYILIKLDGLQPIVDIKNLKLNGYYLTQQHPYSLPQLKTIYFDKNDLTDIRPFQLIDSNGNLINLETPINDYVKTDILNKEIKILESIKTIDSDPSDFKSMGIRNLIELKNSTLVHIDNLIFNAEYLAVQNDNKLACIFYTEINNEIYYAFVQHAYRNIESILRRMVKNKNIKLFYPKVPNFYDYDTIEHKNDVVREFTTGKYYYCTLHNIYNHEESPFGKIVTIENFNWIDEGSNNIFLEVTFKDIETNKEYTDIIAYRKRYSSGWTFCYYLHEVKEIYEDDIYVKIIRPDIFGLKSNGTEILKCKIEWTDEHDLYVFKSGRVIFDMDVENGIKIYNPRKAWADKKDVDLNTATYNYDQRLYGIESLPSYTRNINARAYSIIFASEALKKRAISRFQRIHPLPVYRTDFNKDYYISDSLKHLLPIKEDKGY